MPGAIRDKYQYSRAPTSGGLAQYAGYDAPSQRWATRCADYEVTNYL
jgi:hypothetical protein